MVLHFSLLACISEFWEGLLEHGLELVLSGGTVLGVVIGVAITIADALNY